MKNRKKRSFLYLAPPQADVGHEGLIFAIGAALAALYSTIFLDRYFNARSDLYQWIGDKKVLVEGLVMPEFSVLRVGVLNGFALLALSMLAAVLWHYMSYRVGSMSIYVMRRLPDQRVIHRQCWTLPILGAVLSGLAALLMLGIYYLVYLYATPAGCLPVG